MEASPEPSSSSQRFPENLLPEWKRLLTPEAEAPYFKKLSVFLNKEYREKRTIYPPRHLILSALQSVDYDRVRVVILGQDPYHGPGQAIGLSFAVPNTLRPKPPSLMNIYKEISADLGLDMKGKGSDLSGWTEQGVLLLNTVLTVRSGQAHSHRGQGWEQFTQKIIEQLNQREQPLVFILWGAAAQKKKEFIDGKRHLILESAHPSPLSADRGFFGCRHFSKTNAFLKKHGMEPIDWGRTSLNTSKS